MHVIPLFIGAHGETTSRVVANLRAGRLESEFVL